MPRSIHKRPNTIIRIVAALPIHGGALRILAIAFVACLSGISVAQTPTPTCNPDVVQATISPADPTFVPNEPFVLNLEPRDGDWPTTPTFVNWEYIDPDSGYPVDVGFSLTLEMKLPPPDVEVLELHAAATGPGIREDCPDWTTGLLTVEVRRFDYTPSPTPTPTPTPPPCTPVGTPCDDPDMRAMLRPPHFSEDNPTSLVLVVPGTFYGLDTSGTSNHTVTPLGGDEYLAENLLPGATYIVYFSTGWCWGNAGPNPNTCLNIFSTREEEPTPTPTPTPTPAPTPDAEGWMISGAPGPGSRAPSGESGGRARRTPKGLSR